MLDAVKRTSCYVYQKTLNSPELAIRTVASVILYEVTKIALKKVSKVSMVYFAKVKQEACHAYNYIWRKEKFVCHECRNKVHEKKTNEVRERVIHQNKPDSKSHNIGLNITPNGDEPTREQIVDLIEKDQQGTLMIGQ